MLPERWHGIHARLKGVAVAGRQQGSGRSILGGSSS
jgi:hypothetical protein